METGKGREEKTNTILLSEMEEIVVLLCSPSPSYV